MPRSKRIPLSIAAVAVLLAGFAAYAYLPVLPFAAAFHDGTGEHRLFERPLSGQSEVQAVAGVLEAYGECFRQTSDGRLLVPLRLSFDGELRWNYTSKAGL
jgi:hypothetical protein